MTKSRWLFRLADGILPYLASLTYFLLLIEAVSYIGFLHQFIGFNSLFFLYSNLLLLGFLSIWLISHPKEELSFYTHFFLKLQSFFLLPLVVIYYIFYLTEQANYDNFVYTTFHVQPQNARYIVILAFWLTLFYLFVSSRRILVQKKVFKSRTQVFNWFNLTIVLYVLLMAFFVNNSINTVGLSIENVIFIFRNPTLSYDRKMFESWKYFYPQMQFVNQHSPETAVIAIPPAQNHWLTDGNSVVVRYFVYPRKVVNLIESEVGTETLYLMPDTSYTHVLLTKGSWQDPTVEFGWPKIPFPVSKIYYQMPDGTASVSAVNTFDPSLEVNKNSYGLIEL